MSSAVTSIHSPGAVGIFTAFYMATTYLPHKAVAEVSKDKEPIGRGRTEFNWFENELMSDSSEVRFK